LPAVAEEVAAPADPQEERYACPSSPAEFRTTVDGAEFGQLGASDGMEREFGAVGVDQDIRVNRYHGVAPARSEQSRYSSRAALLSISSVGIRLPRVAGRSSRNSVRTGSPASSLRRALEMSAVSVIPRRRACSRAARIRSSSRFAVVFTAQPYTTSHTAHTKTGSAIPMASAGYESLSCQSARCRAYSTSPCSSPSIR